MKILITGGGGFLGGGIARALIKKGHDVRSFSRGDYPELRALNIETLRGDITDEHQLSDATAGCDVVFHVAAKTGVWGPCREYYMTNVVGTKNVVKACRDNTIRYLIFTSSPSVVFHGKDQKGINESEPYPSRYLAHYPKTKAIAEKHVLEMSSKDFLTVSLRPHLIWGPRDPHLVPRIISRAKAGQLRLVGNGKNLVDSVYIDNAVDAHILAMEHLLSGTQISGKAYFITNGEPLPIADLINKILDAAGLKPVSDKVPAGIAFMAGAIMEFLYIIARQNKEPRMTRFVAKELSCAHWFDIASARRDFGYIPSVSIDEGMLKLKEWLSKSPA